jgi:exopolyphosphatase / guanosine-5'-triphosphate,3'-diphosphate pyrophosphatase
MPYNSNRSKVAVIDLGTNTFHLLISSPESPLSHPDLLRLRKYVKLGEYAPDYIGREAFRRGVETISEFAAIAEREGVSRTVAVGTAMLRNAVNARDFTRAVKEETGVEIEIISGQKEARFIFQGARLSGTMSGENDLIMDIGGGSVEFILSRKFEAVWYGSYDIGVSFLKHRFHKKDPITKDEILALREHFRHRLQPLISQMEKLHKLRLIGLSGTFDVIDEHMRLKKGIQSVTIPIQAVREFTEEILPLTLEERIAHPSIPESRADLIPVALVLVDFIIGLQEVKSLSTSPYSIKEGILASLV